MLRAHRLTRFGPADLNDVPAWRGLSEVAIGQPDKAEADFRTALLRRPGYKLAIEALASL